MSERKSSTEIRVRQAPELSGQLHNIAANLGVSFQKFIRKELREIVKSYPDHYRQPVKNDE